MSSIKFNLNKPNKPIVKVSGEGMEILQNDTLVDECVDEGKNELRDLIKRVKKKKVKFHDQPIVLEDEAKHEPPIIDLCGRIGDYNVVIMVRKRDESDEQI